MSVLDAGATCGHSLAILQERCASNLRSNRHPDRRCSGARALGRALREARGGAQHTHACPCEHEHNTDVDMGVETISCEHGHALQVPRQAAGRRRRWLEGVGEVRNSSSSSTAAHPRLALVSATLDSFRPQPRTSPWLAFFDKLSLDSLSLSSTTGMRAARATTPSVTATYAGSRVLLTTPSTLRRRKGRLNRHATLVTSGGR